MLFTSEEFKHLLNSPVKFLDMFVDKKHLPALLQDWDVQYASTKASFYCDDCGRSLQSCICVDNEETPKMGSPFDPPKLEPEFEFERKLPPPPPRNSKPKVDDLIEIPAHMLMGAKSLCYLCGFIKELVIVKSSKARICLDCAEEHLKPV